MKKTLLFTLALAVGMTGFAQTRVVLKKTDLSKQSVIVNALEQKEESAPGINFGKHETLPMTSRATNVFEEFETMATNYDKQTNGCIGNRIAGWADGTASVVATWDYSGTTSYPDRGAGYNYYDGAGIGDQPTERIEPVKSGWPSICAAGDAEILVSHATGTNVYRRETKGEGEWTQITNLPELQWPRVCASGNGQYVHIVGANSTTDPQGNTIYTNWYSRSTDGGLTWSTPTTPPEVDPELVHNEIGADDYVMASNGNTIAILFGGLSYEMFYIISYDNGETWEKHLVVEFPYGHGHDWYDESITSATDSIWWMDNSQSIAVDNNNVVHVAFGLTRWTPAPESGYGYISYWPYTDAIVYWNSEYVNAEGGHEILRFGKEPSVDSQNPDWLLNGTDGASSTLNEDRIWALAEADGHQHLHMFGWPDEDGDGAVSYNEYWDGHLAYADYGIANSPGIAIDEHGNMAIVYSVLSEIRIDESKQFYYRSAYVTYRDRWGYWYDDYENLFEDFLHTYQECYPTFALCNGFDNTFWVAYSADESIGLYIDSEQDGLTDNYIYLVKLQPECTGVIENQAINPMTAVRVYPNPAQDMLSIEVNASQASEMNIAVYSITGQKVMETNTNIAAGINTPSINVKDLTSGIYFVTVKANGFENTMKFVVR